MVHPDGGISPPPGAVIYKTKNQILPAHLTRRRYKKRGCACHKGRCCMTSLCSTGITLIVIIGIGILIFWLYVQPKSPHYTIGNVRITGLDPKAVAAAQKTGSVNTTTTFALEIRNPNKRIGYYYDTVSVNVAILGVQVGNGELPSFFQGHDNITFLTDNLKSGPLSMIELTQTGVLSATQAGQVPLDFKVDVNANVKIGSWKTPKFKIDISCSVFASPTIAPSGTAALGKGCSHKIKFWIF
ncbi:unnamed protein product [Calypogeia fissa]